MCPLSFGVRMYTKQIDRMRGSLWACMARPVPVNVGVIKTKVYHVFICFSEAVWNLCRLEKPGTGAFVQRFWKTLGNGLGLRSLTPSVSRVDEKHTKKQVGLKIFDFHGFQRRANLVCLFALLCTEIRLSPMCRYLIGLCILMCCQIASRI